MSVIFLFVTTPYPKQQTNILRWFCSLKFQYSLFSNKLFRHIFRNKRTVYTVENCRVTKAVTQNDVHFELVTRKLL